MEKWIVTKDGDVKCYGTSGKTFPSDDLIATLRAAGYKVYVDGQLAKSQRKVKQNK